MTRRVPGAIHRSPPTRPSSARGDATRTRITRAARQLAVNEGAKGLSLRAVAAQSGMSLSNLQFHFASQDHLLRAVLDAELANGETFVARALEADKHDPIGAAIDAFLALQHQRGAARLFFTLWAAATTSRPLRAALHAFYADWIARIAQASAPEAKQRAWLFVALLEGAALFRCGVAGSTNKAQEKALRVQLRAIVGYPAAHGAGG